MLAMVIVGIMVGTIVAAATTAGDLIARVVFLPGMVRTMLAMVIVSIMVGTIIPAATTAGKHVLDSLSWARLRTKFSIRTDRSHGRRQHA
ncbi:MAG: hypothetical protein ACRCXM_17775 [Beijerinckiaceae bacterium]